MKQKLIFGLEVIAVLAVVALVQKKVMNVPIVGEFLPGYTVRT